MTKLITCLVFAMVLITPTAAQRRPPATAPAPRPSVVPKPAELTESELKPLAEAISDEDWPKAAQLSTAGIESLKVENTKKQIAQLRYLRIFAMAGIVLSLSGQGKSDEAEAAANELSAVATSYVGKELVMPAREFAENCRGRLNYICHVTDTPKALRVTATNLVGNAIHSFEYIRFEKPPVIDPKAPKIFLGGMLESVDFNEDLSKPWVMRIFLTKGFIFAPK